MSALTLCTLSVCRNFVQSSDSFHTQAGPRLQPHPANREPARSFLWSMLSLFNRETLPVTVIYNLCFQNKTFVVFSLFADCSHETPPQPLKLVFHLPTWDVGILCFHCPCCCMTHFAEVCMCRRQRKKHLIFLKAQVRTLNSMMTVCPPATFLYKLVVHTVAYLF